MYVLFYALWPFDVAKGGEKMGILDIKILYFQSFKIKHKFKKKGGERDDRRGRRRFGG